MPVEVKPRIPVFLCYLSQKGLWQQELWIYNNFPGHLFRGTVTANLLDDSPDKSNLTQVGFTDTFISCVIFLGQAVTSAFLVWDPIPVTLLGKVLCKVNFHFPFQFCHENFSCW